MATEKLYDLWAKRSPQWEKRYEDSLLKTFCDYGRGETSLREARGKLFGAGYELYIIAFFIGLYYGQRRPLNEDNQKRKDFGWAIKNWGNIEQRLGRKPYPKICEYLFVALIAKTDFDFIALEKGETTPRKAVDMLIQTMEEYANWGFHFMEDKLSDDSNYFYQETAFLEVFLSFDATVNPTTSDDEPESLD
ncbi:MAG: glycoside hydrolase family 15 [Massilibacteroides sp.]|nr:glycoside hydrolase family 15 [Massilibacteroides sp.]